MITSPTTIYRTCRSCKQNKPLDAVHFRVFSAVSNRSATACLACEIELAARRGETLPLVAAEPVIPRETPLIQLGLGGTMHRYPIGKDESLENAANNPTGRNGSTAANVVAGYQLRTLTAWREAVEAVTWRHGYDSAAYHDACDALWNALPDDWQDAVSHATFCVFAAKVRDGE
jgi:hypothetical protein